MDIAKKIVAMGVAVVLADPALLLSRFLHRTAVLQVHPVNGFSVR